MLSTSAPPEERKENAISKSTISISVPAHTDSFVINITRATIDRSSISSAAVASLSPVTTVANQVFPNNLTTTTPNAAVGQSNLPSAAIAVPSAAATHPALPCVYEGIQILNSKVFNIHHHLWFNVNATCGDISKSIKEHFFPHLSNEYKIFLHAKKRFSDNQLFKDYQTDTVIMFIEDPHGRPFFEKISNETRAKVSIPANAPVQLMI